MQIEREHEFAIQQFNAIPVKLCLWHFLLKSVALVIGNLHASPADDVRSCDGFFFLYPNITTTRQWQRRGRCQLAPLAPGLLDDIFYVTILPHCNPGHPTVSGKHFSAVLVVQINLLLNHLCLCLPVTLDRFYDHA